MLFEEALGWVLGSTALSHFYSHVDHIRPAFNAIRSKTEVHIYADMHHRELKMDVCVSVYSNGPIASIIRGPNYMGHVAQRITVMGTPFPWNRASEIYFVKYKTTRDLQTGEERYLGYRIFSTLSR